MNVTVPTWMGTLMRQNQFNRLADGVGGMANPDRDYQRG